MSTAQFAREPCRQMFHRPRIQVRSTPFGECCRPTRRGFSETCAVRADEEGGGSDRIRQAKTPTRLRRRMYAWLNGPGKAFAAPLRGSTNYLSAYNASGRLVRARPNRGREESGSDKRRRGQGEELEPERDEDLRPYPLNDNFISQSVLSDPLKNAIYDKVVGKGQSVSAVSAELGVDMRRVAAVVRLKEVEKLWEKEGKPLAESYGRSVMDMLPQTRYNAEEPIPHEPINDLPVHPATKQQIFYPTSESRQFTRNDAAKVFSPSLLPADERIPHPELVQSERGNASMSAADKARLAERLRQAAATARAKADEKRQAAEAARTTVVKGSRWNFKFESINATVAAGKDGRGAAGVGWRYGMPYEDRKRGHLKGVPTKVEV